MWKSGGRLLGSLLALSAFVAGCAQASFSYQPKSPPAEVYSVKAPVTLTVVPFTDARPRQNTFGGYGLNGYPCLLPPTPFCTADYQRPETEHSFVTRTSYEFRPQDDLARAVAEEIKQVGLFEDVKVARASNLSEGPLVMRGQISSTRWRGSLYTYLLGPYDAFAWLVGAPIGSSWNELRLSLQLVDQRTDKTLWTYELYGAESHTEWLYYNYGRDFTYPAILQSQVPEMLKSLALYIGSQPRTFWEKMAAHSGASRSPNG